MGQPCNFYLHGERAEARLPRISVHVVRLAVVEADAPPLRPAVPRRPGGLEDSALVPAAVAELAGHPRAR